MNACDYLALAVPGVRDLHPYQPGKPIEELQRELGLEDIIKLASNENPLGAGVLAREAAGGALADLHRYPDGGAYRLKHKLAERYDLLPAQLTIGNGSNEILELVARAFVRPGDEVIFSQHAFAVYPIVTQAVGARAMVVPANDYGHDLEGMVDAITPRTRLIFIANPNNPTGTWLRRAALQRFLERVSPQVIVVLDEAYFEYVTEVDYPDGMCWLATFPNLVVSRTFSKIHGLAALRIGFAAANAGISEVLNRVRQPFNVNHVAMAAAVAALEDHSHVLQSRDNNLKGMRQLQRAFDGKGLRYIPSVGNFIAVEVGNADRVYRELLRRGVIVRPIANYEMPLHLRVTIGTAAENTRFLDALNEVIAHRG